MSQTALNVQFEYKSTIRGVKLFPGIQADELQGILKSVFALSSNIVGFTGEDNMIIPLSLACRSPHLLTNQVFSLVVSGEDSLNSSLNNSLNIEDLSKDNNDIEVATAEIFRFIAGLKSKNIINEHQSKLLEENLDDSNLLFAAYSVAVSANDARYLANICKDISQSLETEAGQLACEAQDEVLQICDQLYLNKRITENQLLYLRHLVLIREEAVADIYDDYQDQKIGTSEMAKLLYELANVHPKDNAFNLSSTTATTATATTATANSGGIAALKHRGAAGGGNEEEEEDEYEAEKNKKAITATSAAKGKVATATTTTAATKKQLPPSAAQSHNTATAATRASEANNNLSSVVVSMIDSNLLSTTDAGLLIEMVKDKNEYVMAAFELFLDDEDENELIDTLLRCLRLEVKKRGFMKKMEQLSAEQQQQLQQHLLEQYNVSTTTGKANKKVDAEEEEEDNDNDDEEEDFDELDDLMLKQGYDYSENVEDEEEDEDEEDEDEEDDETTATMDTDIIMSALSIDNVWKQSVPAIFISTLFKAAYRKQISNNQAIKACDMYQQGDDYIRAVWGVYNLQKDEVDFIDSINRITRRFAVVEKEEVGVKQRGGSVSEARLRDEKQNQLRQQQSQLQAQLAANEQEKSRVLHSKEEAMSAIKDAKKELLKHSLDMMVTSNVISQSEADKVYQLVDNTTSPSYSLVDHVIDTYAANRDVAEFMNHLKMLADFVSGELDEFMMDGSNNNSGGKNTGSGLGEDGMKELRDLRQTVANKKGSTLPPQPPSATKSISHSSSTASSPTSTTKTQQSKTHTIKRKNAAASGSTLLESDDDSSSLIKREQIELSQIILELNKAKVVNDRDASYLLQLVKRKDEAIMKCYEALLKERNFDSFIESLLSRTSSSGGSVGSGTSVSGSSTSGSSSADADESNNGSASSSSNQNPDSLLSPLNQKAVIDILANANAITPNQVEKIKKLIDVKDRSVTRTFIAYENTKNLEQLIVSLKGLEIPIYKLSDQKGTAKFLKPTAGNNNKKRSESPTTYAVTMASSESPRWADDDEEDEENDGDEEEEDDEGEDEDDSDDDNNDDDNDEDEDDYDDEEDKGYIEAKFLEIIQNMKLSPNDTSALRLAISRDDNLIRNALESYRLSLNESALVTSLYQVIQKTTVDIQKTDNDVFVPDEDSDTELMDSPRKMDSPRLNPDALPSSFNSERIVTAPVVPSPSNATNGSAKNRFTFNNTAATAAGVNTASTATSTSVTAAMTNGIHSNSKNNNTYETEDEAASTENEEDDQYTQDAADYELQDEDDDDEDEDELNTTANAAGMMTSTTVRNHIFPILITELVKENIMSASDSSLVAKLFAQGNPSINAALDIYDVDHDMGDLVETLQGIALTSGGSA